MTGIAAYPVQYHPQTRELTIYESLRIVVAFEGAPEATLRGTAAPDSAAYEALLGRELLNYEAARPWRQPIASPAAAPAEAAAPDESTSNHKADPLARADLFMDRASWWVLGLVFLYMLGQIIRAVMS